MAELNDMKKVVHDTPRKKKSSLTKNTFAVHKLDYSLPEVFEVTNSVHQVEQYPHQSAVAKNETLRFTINNSDGFINAEKSYMRFKVTYSFTRKGTGSASNFNFAGGSVMNLISQVSHRSASGEKMYDEQRVGSRRYYQNRYEKSFDWIKTTGQLMGMTVLGDTGKVDKITGANIAADTTTADVETEVTYIVPMSQFGGIWGLKQLIPSYAISGSKFDINWNQDINQVLEHPLVGAGYNVTNTSVFADYKISDVVLMTEMHLFNDATLTAFKQQASKEHGIQLMYDGWDSQSAGTTTGSSLNVQITKSVSNATQAFINTRLTANASLITADSFASEGVVPSKLYWRLGSMTFPNAPLTAGSSKEILYQAYLAFMKHDSNNGCSVREADGSHWVNAVNLRQVDNSPLGLPVNMGRTLNVDVNWAGSANRTHEYHFKYLQLLRVFLNKVVVYQ